MKTTTNTKAPNPAEQPTPQPLRTKTTRGVAESTASSSRPARPARINVDAARGGRTRSANRSTRGLAHADDASNADRAANKQPRALRPKRSPSQRRAAIASKPKRLSALDAAAQVLAALKGPEAKAGIAAPDLIERMKKATLWSSPGGQTPAATLYAGMIREAKAKGRASRFRRVAPGRFVAGPAAKSRAKVTA